jgi:glycosyltransferase involved in cell wall biosynthesis
VISVVFATHNRGTDLGRTLASFREARAPLRTPWELLVVDNNSTDGTPGVIAEFGRDSGLPLRSLSERRQGKSFAINSGILAARGEVLAFTDDDATVDVAYLRAVERAVDEHDALAFGGRVVAVWPARAPVWLLDEPALRSTRAGVVAYDMGDSVVELGRGVRPPAGANFFCRRRAFERYGLFREDLGPNANDQLYAEDTDFVERLRSAGERVLYVPGVVVYHPVSAARLRKRYGLRWCFRVGRSAARMQGRVRGIPAVAGAPRYLFAMLLGAVAQRITASLRGTPSARYDRTQEVVYRAGMIYEYLRLPADFDPAVEVARVRWPAAAPAPTAIPDLARER